MDGKTKKPLKCYRTTWDCRHLWFSWQCDRDSPSTDASLGILALIEAGGCRQLGAIRTELTLIISCFPLYALAVGGLMPDMMLWALSLLGLAGVMSDAGHALWAFILGLAYLADTAGLQIPLVLLLLWRQQRYISSCLRNWCPRCRCCCLASTMQQLRGTAFWLIIAFKEFH